MSQEENKKHYSTFSEWRLVLISLLGLLSFTGLFAVLFLKELMSGTAFIAAVVALGVVLAFSVWRLLCFRRK